MYPGQTKKRIQETTIDPGDSRGAGEVKGKLALRTGERDGKKWNVGRISKRAV